MDFTIAVLAAGCAWFFAAGIGFFNPVVDSMYRSQEEHPSVKALPNVPSTIGKILLAVFAQTLLWAMIYRELQFALPTNEVSAGLSFGGIICLVKLVPRDIDRLLLTTYPVKRMTIEFVVGVICAFVVGLTFSHLMT